MANLKPLKVGLVLDDGLDSPDGVQQYMLTLGQWLTQEGHDVYYLVGQTSRQDIPQLYSLSQNITVKFNGNRLGTIPLPTSHRKLKELLKHHDFDVLHVQAPFSPFMGGKLIKFAGPDTAIVGTFHIAPNSLLVSIANRLLGIWCYHSIKRIDILLSVSSAAQSFASNTFHRSSTIVPNVIDSNRFQNAETLNDYNGVTKNILFLGRLVPRKGVRLLIDAAARLKQMTEIPHFRVLICGRGPLLDELRRSANRQGLGQDIIFTGFVSEADKPRYYASADITVFPSSGGESFGIVLLEAMASGRSAVLAGNNPGYASVLAQRPKLLFDPHDPSALASTLAFYLTHEEEREAEALWGKQYVKAFDIKQVGPKIVKIYYQTLLKRAGQ
jgi:phosphatidylinositol alpha-mannosyltransferase